MPETNPECIWKTARCRVCHPVTHPDRTKIVTKQSKQSIPTKATWQWLCTNVSQLRELTCAARGPLCPWSQQAVLWDLSGTNSLQGCQLTNFVRKKVGHKSQKFLNPFAHRSHFRRAFGQPMVSFKSPEHGLRLNRAGKGLQFAPFRAFERERQSGTGISCAPPFIGIFTISRFRSICSLWKTWEVLRSWLWKVKTVNFKKSCMP